MIKLKYSTMAFAHKAKPSDEEAYLVFRVRWNGSRSQVSLNTGFSVTPEYWDATEQRCRKRTVHGRLRIPAQTINAELARYEAAAGRVFERFTQADVWPTVDEVRSRLREELGIDAPRVMSVDEAFGAFLREESARCAWSESTVKKMNTVRKHMAGFPAFRTFEGFTSAGLAGYLEYLRQECGHNDVTCHRQLGYIRWFCAWAEKRHQLRSDDYKTFTPKLKHPDKPVIFLTWDELMKVWSYEATEGQEHLNLVRDIFLFECFTSLRFSDVMSLTWDQVEDGRLSVVTQKTAKALRIDLNKWSDEILSRYIDVSVPGGYVFPRVLNQVANRHLKTIGKACGIDERVVVTEYHGAKRTDEVFEKWGLLGTHAGRRTFVCNALAMGIPPAVVMQWTGHSDYRAMKPYIAVADKTKSEHMGAFNAAKVDTSV